MSITINGDTGIAGVDGSNTTPTLVGNDTNTGVFFPAADTVALATGGVTRFQAGPSGQLGIAGATYGTSGQVLTSGGASAAPSWTTISTGAWVVANSVNTTTSVTSIDFTNLGSYRSLRITINNLQVANDQILVYLRFSSDNGATFLTTNYVWGFTSNSSVTLNSSDITIMDNVGNVSTDGGGTGFYQIQNWNIAQKTAGFGNTLCYSGTGAAIGFTVYFSHQLQTAMNALRVIASSGNITQAQILVEGWTGP